MIKSVEDSKLKPTAEEAWAKWRQYVKACKDHPKNLQYRQLRKIYNEVKNGKIVIDIRTVIRNGGMHPVWVSLPRVAICEVNIPIVECVSYETGHVKYCWKRPDHSWNDTILDCGMILSGIEPKRNGWRFTGETTVPVLPPELVKKTSTYKGEHLWYVLWEVSRWEKVIHHDPYLLRKLTQFMYVVEDQWDLTELEIAMIKGTMY
jgi:hypothetical protein